ncbi:MAG: hypothetical protein JO099_17605 [Acidobacteriia bacterium]|nr:hypothetical protein [Terriglobia bacterium]
MKQFPKQTALTILMVGCLLAAAPLTVPRLPRFRVSEIAALVDFTSEKTPLFPLIPHVPETPPIPLPHPVLPVKVRKAPVSQVSALLDDSNGSLDQFYAALRRTEHGDAGAVTRTVHYGDSPTTADLITGDTRVMLQQRFGDAGHGFVLIAKPWAWYEHRGVELSGSGWQMLPASRFEARDGLFGLGGVSFTGSDSAHTEIKFRDPTQSRFELYYLKQPGGGTITISADGRLIESVDTTSEAKAAGFYPFSVEGGASRIELRPHGNIRLFGITAEKPATGVVYDSLGLNGASVRVMTHIFKAQHWTEQLRHRDPNLVIVNYGTNEADFADFVDHGYEPELREAIGRIRAAVPEASILVMSPMDRGRRSGIGEIETMDTIPRIVEIQRRVAKETGCAFFDTFAAMGGAGTMARWYNAQPRLVSADLIHPYPAGGKQIAEVFVREIEAGFARFKLR